MEIRLAGKKKLGNKTSIPDHEIERIARCLFPDILALYNGAEGQNEFEERKKEREVKMILKKNNRETRKSS